MRFGTIQRPRPKHVRRRGEAVVFRMAFSHRERFWMLVISLLAMTALAVVIRVALDRPAGQPTPEWIGLPMSGMAFPVLFILIAVLTPQRSLRISSRGLCFASTFRRKRRWVRWDDITAVWPGLSRLRTTGREVTLIQFRSLPRPLRTELRQQVESRLALRFDLSQITEHQRRLSRLRKRRTWPWLWDRLALVGLSLAVTIANLSKCLCCSHPALAFAILGVAGGSALLCVRRMVRRIDRDNWLSPRAIGSQALPV